MRPVHQTSMNFAGEHYYSLNRMLLCSIGLWPYQDSKMTKIQRVFSTVILISSIVVQVNHLQAHLSRIHYSDGKNPRILL